MKMYLVTGAVILSLFIAGHVKGYALSSAFHTVHKEHTGPGRHK